MYAAALTNTAELGAEVGRVAGRGRVARSDPWPHSTRVSVPTEYVLLYIAPMRNTAATRGALVIAREFLGVREQMAHERAIAGVLDRRRFKAAQNSFQMEAG